MNERTARRNHLWHLLLLLLSSLVVAANNQRSVTQYTMQLWQTQDGLPQNTINAIAQTTDGYLWLGTDEGLVRFDGQRFVLFDKENTPALRGNRVGSLQSGSHGELWIGFKGSGLACYARGQFQLWTTAEGLPHNFVRTIYDDSKGNVWIGTEDGLARWHKGQFTIWRKADGLPDNRIWEVGGDQKGNVWLGTAAGLTRFHAGQFHTFSRELPDRWIYSLVEDHNGVLWAGTAQGGVLRFVDGRVTQFTIKNGLAHNQVWAMTNDHAGNLWLASTGGGLTRIAESGRVIETFTTRQGFPSDRVQALYEDREGNLWVGTGEGLIRLSAGNLLKWTQREGLSQTTLRSVLEGRDGSVWFGTFGGGVNRLHNGAVTKLGDERDLVNALFEDWRGDLWVGTMAGLKQYRPAQSTRTVRNLTTRDGLPNAEIRVITEDRAGNLWIGSTSGLTRLRDEQLTNFSKADGLPHNIVRGLHEDRNGALWIGTEGGLTVWRDGQFKTFTAAEGVSAPIIQTFYEDNDGTLWIGALDGGLLRYREGKFTSFTRRDGMPDDNIGVILEDASNHLWLGGDRGIFRVSKAELEARAQNPQAQIHPQAFSAESGLGTNQISPFSQPAGYCARDGRLWFATMNGAVMVDPQRLATNTLPPPVFVERALADGRALAMEGTLQIAPGLRELQLHYTALSLTTPEKVRFKYKLEGYDQNWIEAGTRREAFYTNLPPGNYTFRVQACNNDGVWNETGAQLTFTLAPRFYQTIWFYLLCAATLGMLAWAWHRLRLRQMRQRFRAVFAERNRIARELHDTVEQGQVMALAHLDWGVQKLDAAPQQAAQHFELARNLARYNIEETKRSVWDLYDQELERNDLATALTQVAERLTAGLSLHLQLQVSGTPTALPVLVGHHLLRIGQEAIANAIKHSGAQQLIVALQFERHQVRLAVKDDGCGFEQNASSAPLQGDGFGLLGMRERAEKIGAAFALASQPGRGTELIVTVPVG